MKLILKINEYLMEKELQQENLTELLLRLLMENFIKDTTQKKENKPQQELFLAKRLI